MSQFGMHVPQMLWWLTKFYVVMYSCALGLLGLAYLILKDKKK